MGRRPGMKEKTKKELTIRFDNLAMSSKLPPKEVIPLIFQAAQQAAQKNPDLPVTKPSESTFLRNAQDVFGTRLTVAAKPRNKNRIYALELPLAVISHAVVTAAAFMNKEPQFAANCDTCTIAMGRRIGDKPRRTRISTNALKVFAPVTFRSRL